MRIGILTFQFGCNYGGILQCYALQQTLRKYGHQTEVINYIPSPLPLRQRLWAKLKTVRSVKALFGILSALRRPNIAANEELVAQFDRFRSEHISLTPSLNNRQLGSWCNEHYDAIIVGSDQIWTQLYDPHAAYFIGWTPEFTGKRISYAACSAHDFVRRRRKRELAHLLGKFDLITVRDETTARLVDRITGRKPLIVPDPTELYGFDEFAQGERPNGGRPYILTYILGSEIDGGHASALRKIKEEIGDADVYSIVFNRSNSIVGHSDVVATRTGPEEWVSLIAHARAVYTDSFHAILFSMKFGTPFVAYYRDLVRASRLIDLRRKYDLDNIVSHADQIRGLRSFRHEEEDAVLKNLNRPHAC